MTGYPAIPLLVKEVFLSLESTALGLKRTALSLGRLLFTLEALENGPKVCCRNVSCATLSSGCLVCRGSSHFDWQSIGSVKALIGICRVRILCGTILHAVITKVWCTGVVDMHWKHAVGLVLLGDVWVVIGCPALCSVGVHEGRVDSVDLRWMYAAGIILLRHIRMGSFRVLGVGALRWNSAVGEILLQYVLVVSLLGSVRHVVFGGPSPKE